MNTAVTGVSSGTDAAVGGEIQVIFRTEGKADQVFPEPWAGKGIWEALYAIDDDSSMPVWSDPVSLRRGGEEKVVDYESDVTLLQDGDDLIVAF